MSAEVVCDYCQRPAELVTGEVTYPHRKDLARRLFWHCAPCQAWVSCHLPAGTPGQRGRGDGTLPMGRLAKADLRQWRTSFHAVFDPIWKTGTMTRDAAYAVIAKEMGIDESKCNSSLFSLEQCQDATRIAAGVDLTGPSR